jgi:hypothetical protein
MKRMLVVLVAIVVAIGVIGVGAAAAASGGPPWSGGGQGPNASCPYSKDGKPIRARDGSGPRHRTTTATPQQKRDGTGPHGPRWQAAS